MIALVDSLIPLCFKRTKRLIVVKLSIAWVSMQIYQNWTKVAPLYGSSKDIICLLFWDAVKASENLA